MSKPKKHYRKPILPPAPPRPGTTKSQAEPPESEQWLDSIDPERLRHKRKVITFDRPMTKEDANEWLVHVPDYQRNRRPQKVKDYMEDMNEGYWIHGVAEVVFDRKGDMIQGQHVCTALVCSKLQELECVSVKINRYPDAYLGYDLGMRRNLADNLKGQTDSPGEVGKVLNVIRLWDKGIYKEKGYMTAREGSVRLAGRRGRELLAKHPGITKFLFPNPFTGNKGERSIAAMRAAYYRLHQIDPEMADRFFHCFITGEDMSQGHPVLALCHRFRHMGENERWRSGPTLALILNAWELFVAGEKVSTLPFKLGKSPFPEVAVPLPLPASSKSSLRVH